MLRREEDLARQLANLLLSFEPDIERLAKLHKGIEATIDQLYSLHLEVSERDGTIALDKSVLEGYWEKRDDGQYYATAAWIAYLKANRLLPFLVEVRSEQRATGEVTAAQYRRAWVREARARYTDLAAALGPDEGVRLCRTKIRNALGGINWRAVEDQLVADEGFLPMRNRLRDLVRDAHMAD